MRTWPVEFVWLEVLSPNNRMRAQYCLFLSVNEQKAQFRRVLIPQHCCLAAVRERGVALWWPCVVEVLVACLLACVRKASNLAQGGRPAGHMKGEKNLCEEDNDTIM